MSRDEVDFLTVAPAPTPAAPPALAAFLRGIGRRSLVFAALQAGEGADVDAAVARAVSGFASDAADRPMGTWPSRYWGRLLAALPRPDPVARPMGATAGLEALGPPGSGARTALLLALVAGLDEEDGGGALGVDAPTWRLALRRAAPHDAAGAFDEARWRQWAEAAREAQRDLPDARLAWWERLCTAALATPAIVADAGRGQDVPSVARDGAHRGRVLRVLWIAVGACALAFAATFVPWRAPAPERADTEAPPPNAVALAASVAPDATYDADFALRHHPDLPRLLAGDDELLRDLDFGAWYATQADPGADAGDALPVVQALPAFDALSTVQRRQLQDRAAANDALPRAERGALRERWDAWTRLPPRERDRVRVALAAFAKLPGDAREALRSGFAALPADLQRGWLLGPTLGARWEGLQPLLQQVPVDEREPLLARLHAMDGEALDALALQARRTPPQARDALRRRLIGEPPQAP